MHNNSYPPTSQYPAQGYYQTQGQSSESSQAANAWPNNYAQGSSWPAHIPAESLSGTLNGYQDRIPSGMPPVRSAHATEAYSYVHRKNPDPLGSLASMPNQFIDMYSETSAIGARGRTPAVYSVAFTTDPSYRAHYETSGTHKRSSKSDQSYGTELQNYRVQDAYYNTGIGEPVQNEEWEPGQCAESQSLPPIVRHACEHIQRGGGSVRIYSYAIERDGTRKGMCRTCADLTKRLERQYPQLTIIDGANQFRGGYPENWSASDSYGPR